MAEINLLSPSDNVAEFVRSREGNGDLPLRLRQMR